MKRIEYVMFRFKIIIFILCESFKQCNCKCFTLISTKLFHYFKTNDCYLDLCSVDAEILGETLKLFKRGCSQLCEKSELMWIHY